jgi:superfamily I DNA/RNA helicase
MAVIYRTNMQGAPIEKQLREAAIPYVVYGGYSFYQRESVQTALAALKLAVAPDNDTCLRRIIGLQKGIGETSVAQLVADRDNGIASLLNKTAPAATTPGLPSLFLFSDDDFEEADSNSLAPNVTRPTFTVKDEYNGGNIKDPKTGKDLRVPLAYISPELESIARNLELNGSRESLFATIIARNNAIASGERPADMRQLKAQDAFADLASCIGALHLSAKATDVSLKDNNLTTILDLALSVLGIDDYYQKQDEAEKLEEGNRHTEYLTELRAHAMGFEDQVIAAIKLEQREAGIAEGSDILTASQQHRLNPETMIGEWLDQINLEASKQDNDSNNDSPDKLSLMTIHAAKGLEFNSVYVCGVVDGVMPHARAVQEDSERDDDTNPGVAEERRLFYVALTRAKKYLGVSAYTQKYDHVQKKNLPVATSEFLYEIPGNKVMLNDRRTKTHYSQHLPDLDLVNMGGYQREHAKHFKDATRAVPYGGSMPVFIRPELANEKYYANVGKAANIEVEAEVGVKPDRASTGEGSAAIEADKNKNKGAAHSVDIPMRRRVVKPG